MSPTIKRLASGLYILTAVLVFGYLLFPADPIKTYIVNQTGARLPGYRVTIENLVPRLPPAMKMSGVDIFHFNTHLISAADFTLRPSLGSLFSSDKSYSFFGRLHQGTLNGKIKLQNGSQAETYDLRTEIEGIDLTTLPALETWREQLTSGTLNGRLRYEQRSAEPSLGAQFNLSDVTVKLDIPVEKLDHLLFTSINADLEAEGSKLEIRQCKFSGPQGEGQITGTIHLRNPRKASTLNLSGHFKPNPGLIMQLQGTLWGQMLTARKGQATAGYPFRIRGSAGAPQWQLR